MRENEDSFRSIVTEALRDGTALLLIDGLDEISSDKERVVFVRQLRTFLSRYPQAAVIVTSREAGFRIIGGALANHCDHFTVAEFDLDDIKNVTVSWYIQLVGDKQSVRSEAKLIAESICKINRVFRLAKNPLLLTTILMVRRWIGHIPNKRTVLYEKAIEVLLMTWNVEAHEPLDREEVVPQLAFVAFAMLKAGKQRISESSLRKLLHQARTEMPEFLAYARLSVSDLIGRVELRSSLLILVGLDTEEGKLQRFYEFRHLTFQEYLTAVSLAEGFYPGRNEMDTPLTILKGHIEDQTWKEVIPLTAVLSGRNAHSLISYLVEESRSTEQLARPWIIGRMVSGKIQPHSLSGISTYSRQVSPQSLLFQSIVDEVRVPPVLLEEAMETLAVNPGGIEGDPLRGIFRAQHSSNIERLCEIIEAPSGKDFLSNLLKRYKADSSNRYRRACAIANLVAAEQGARQVDLDKLRKILKSNNWTQKVKACLYVWGSYESQASYITNYISFLSVQHFDSSKMELEDKGQEEIELVKCAISMLWTREPWIQFTGAALICWPYRNRTDNILAQQESNAAIDDPKILERLVELWCDSEGEDMTNICAAAIIRVAGFDRNSVTIYDPESKISQFLVTQFESEDNSFRNGVNTMAAVITGFYLKRLWI